VSFFGVPGHEFFTAQYAHVGAFHGLLPHGNTVPSMVTNQWEDPMEGSHTHKTKQKSINILFQSHFMHIFIQNINIIQEKYGMNSSNFRLKFVQAKITGVHAVIFA
jgi:hypothetical protein